MSRQIGLRRDVSHYSLLLHERGWVANHDGNVSQRAAGDRFFITPTAISKRLCAPETIVECRMDGTPVSKGRPPSEVALHVGAFRGREDVRAVIHAHPPHASAFALLGQPLAPTMPEVVVSIGPSIPVLPLYVPKDPAVTEAIGALLKTTDVALLAGNGALAVGPDLETAFLRLELLEHFSQILTVARQLGSVPSLPDEALQRCISLRKKAGLHREAAPAASQGGSIEKVVLEEVRRALGVK